MVDSGQRAIEWIDSAFVRFGENDAFSSTQAMLLVREKQFVEAERLYRILLSRDTSYVPSKINLANTLASQDSRPKKREAVDLYKNIQETASEQMLIDFKIDSMITALEAEIK